MRLHDLLFDKTLSIYFFDDNKILVADCLSSQHFGTLLAVPSTEQIGG